MSTKTYIPEHYAPLLNLYDTQKAIGLLKRLFEDTLGGALHLRRVSAPLFVEAATGLNDDLNGVERPVSFDIPAAGRDAQVVHSLAKWKRMALLPLPVLRGRGAVHRHERHPPGRGARTTSTPSMWTSGTGRRSSPPGTGTWTI